MVRFIFLIENKHAPISNQEKHKYENKDKCFFYIQCVKISQMEVQNIKSC